MKTGTIYENELLFIHVASHFLQFLHNAASFTAGDGNGGRTSGLHVSWTRTNCLIILCIIITMRVLQRRGIKYYTFTEIQDLKVIINTVISKLSLYPKQYL